MGRGNKSGKHGKSKHRVGVPVGATPTKPRLPTKLSTGPGARRMSDVLVEFARPMTDVLPPGTSIEKRESVLTVASLIWNSLILVELDVPGADPADPEWSKLPAVRNVAERIGSSMSAPEDEVTEVLRAMALKKREVAPHDRRIIANVRVVRENDRIRVYAASVSTA
jgi:hypothetical protein